MLDDMDSYILNCSSDMTTPCLVWYRPVLEANIREAIRIAGDAERLWPHIKTGKCGELIRMMIEKGINRFKCATLAEMEVCAEAGAGHVALAYPLVGPNRRLFLEIAERYPSCEFFAIGDDMEQLDLLSEEAAARGTTVNLLIDVNVGQDRTGVPKERLEDLYAACAEKKGLRLRGMHVYDGHRHEKDPGMRMKAVLRETESIFAIRECLERRGLDCGIMLMGGTPTFPCYAQIERVFLSPGTCFIQDAGYAASFPDLPFRIGALLMTRVISHPREDLFTLDLGYKAVAADPQIPRVVVAGYEDCETVMQNEEHLVLRMPSGSRKRKPGIWEVLYAAPVHICPTTLLYPFVWIAENGNIVDTWNIEARDRKILCMKQEPMKKKTQ